MSDPFYEFLEESLGDGRLSRSEVKALRAAFNDDPKRWARSDVYAQRALQLAKREIRNPQDRETLDWLFDVLKVLRPQISDLSNPDVETVDFSPGDEPRFRIQALIKNAKQRIDCCVFTITDDRLSDALIAAHERGIQLRVISDDDKAHDRGSDITRLSRLGIKTRVDKTSAHMHHKFALFDESTLLTGSYNWTRSAARENAENILTTQSKHLVKTFQNYFDVLWDRLDPHRQT